MNFIFQGYDLRKSKRQTYGPGIYSAPDPRIAALYAKEFSYRGRIYLAMMQNRVDMTKTTAVRNIEELKDKSDYHYVTSRVDGIRPYGLLIKEIEEPTCCSIM